MKHTNAALLEGLYTKFSQGNWEGVLALCPDQITFQIAGQSKLAGKYTKSNFISGLATKLRELSEGTFQIDVHDILASDRHATVLATTQVTRNGKKTELRTVHVWRFENGSPVAWYEYPRDLYQFDLVWA